MSELLVGYARVSTDAQDLTAQRDGLQALGVEPDRIYVDHGLSGTTRGRPRLGEALAACRVGDELVVTNLDRLARSLPDARDIADELTRRNVRLNLAARSMTRPTQWAGSCSAYWPWSPSSRQTSFARARAKAEFEADLIRARTREGMKVAKAKGRLRGKQPKLSPIQEKHLVELYRAGQHTVSELEELFSITRSTVYRAIRRADGRASARHPTRPRRRSASARTRGVCRM